MDKQKITTESVKLASKQCSLNPENPTHLGLLLAYTVAMCAIFINILNIRREIKKDPYYINKIKSTWKGVSSTKKTIGSGIFARATLIIFAIATLFLVSSIIYVFNIPMIKIFNNSETLICASLYLALFGTCLGVFDIIRFALIR